MARLVRSSQRPFGLLLCNYALNQGATVAESVNSFLDYSRFPYYAYSSALGFNEDFDFDAFDFLVVHYSIIPSLPGFVTRGVEERIRRFKGLKIQMIQDDYRMNGRLVRFIRNCGIEIVYTVAPPQSAKALYSDQIPGLDVETYLTGYVSNWLRVIPPKPLTKRRYDVGYRGRRYPYWFGEPTVAKVDTAEDLNKRLRKSGVRCNFSTREEDRLYGSYWVDFLRDCKGIFAVETDVQYVDPFGYLHHWYDTQEKLSGRKKWDGKASLEEPFFKEHARPVAGSLAVIAPRVFEAIGIRSVNLLFEGRYSDILVPWRHYLPVRRDLSNVRDIIQALRDDKLLSNVIAVAFAEIGQRREYTYEGFADQIDATVERHLGPKLVESHRSEQLVETRAFKGNGGDTTEPAAEFRGSSRDRAECGGIDISALEEVAKFYYVGNPNLLAVDNPVQRFPIKQKLKAALRRLRHRRI